MHHKKLIGLTAALLLVVGGLAGCQNHKSSSDSSSSSKITKTSKASMQNSSSDNASSSQSSSSSSSTADTQSSSNQSSSSSTTGSELSTQNAQIKQKLGNVLLPNNDGLTSGSQSLKLTSNGNQSNYTITYRVGHQAPYATFQKKTYGSSSAAASAVNYRSTAADKGLPKVKLTSKITARQNSGAGQTYLIWNEGRWSIATHGSNVNNTNPKATAVHAAQLFDQYMLPAPQTRGAIELNVHSAKDQSRDQTIKWQDGQSVYTLAAQSVDSAVKMAASVK